MNRLPSFPLLIKVKPFADFFKQGENGIRSKLESVAFIRGIVKLLDCVIKSARCSHHRHGAVTHAVHLVESAGFIQRRHQEKISTGFNLMGQRLAGKAFVDAHAMRRRVVPALQEVFVFARARTESDEEGAGVENAARALSNQVVTLLLNQPRNDGDDGSLRLFRQIEAT